MKIFLPLILLLNYVVLAQEAPAETKYTANNKGKFTLNWGWNRESYTDSDINFRGNDYDFTLYNVSASDRPKGIHIDYINPSRVTIPEVNYKIGYFITHKYQVSIGLDHMKYVMNQNQTVEMSGYINTPGYETGGSVNQPKTLTSDFLMFEHTDGLNYINTELTRFDDVSKWIGSDIDKFQLNVLAGAGIGVLYPRTNTTLMNNQRYDEFHLAGYGASIKAGLNITFLKYFFIQSELKGGYINMPDIRTTMNSSDRASQSFYFLQRNILIGGIFRI